MIVVTGTKRSGTSMWMQVLQAGGIQTVGSAFGKVWGETIRDANKRGFFESAFRRGIYYATNPVPETGKWIHPTKSRHWGVKVFVPGVVRSDVLYLSKVIASVRPFRQYALSLTRLYEMERDAHRKRGTEENILHRLDPILEWWLENFLLIRDITTRRYATRLVSYESMLEDPHAICEKIFEWLQVGDAQAALEAVHPEDRTQTSSSAAETSHEFEEIFDEYHHRVKGGLSFDEKFLQKMNDTHEALLPQIESGLSDVAAQAMLRRARLAAQGKEKKQDPFDIDRLDLLLHPPRLTGGNLQEEGKEGEAAPG